MPEPNDIPTCSVSELRNRLESKLVSITISSHSPSSPYSAPGTPATPYKPNLSPLLCRDEKEVKKAAPLPPPSKRAASCTDRPPIAPKPRFKSPERPQQLVIPFTSERNLSLFTECKNETSRSNMASATNVRNVAAHFDNLISSGKLGVPGISLTDASADDVTTENMCNSPIPTVGDSGSWNDELSDCSEYSDYEVPVTVQPFDTSATTKSDDELPEEWDRRKAYTFAGRKMPPEMVEELKSRKSFRSNNNDIPKEENVLEYEDDRNLVGIPEVLGKIRSPDVRKKREAFSDTLEATTSSTSTVNFRRSSDNGKSKRPPGTFASRTSATSDASTATLSSLSSQQSESVVYSTGDPAEDMRLKKLHYAAQEIYTVEKKFVEELHLVADEYPKFLVTYGKECGSNLLIPYANGQAHIVNQITTQLLMIKGAHEFLLEKFAAKMKNWDSREPSMAECLKNNSQFLKFCLPYLKEKKRYANELMKQLQEDEEFAKATAAFEAHTPTRISILQRLDIVHQNVVRYTILMESYKKYLPNSSEMKNCEDAIKELAKVSESVNQQISLAEMEKRLLDIYRRLEGKFNVFEANRHLLHEGELMKQSRKELQLRYLILFSDVLLICKYSRGPSLSSDSFQPDFYQFSILSIRVIAEEHGESETHFQLLSTKKSAVFIAKTKRERDDWVKRLSNAKTEARKLRFNTLSRRRKVINTTSIPECASPVIPEPVSSLISAEVSGKEHSDSEIFAVPYLPVSEKYAAPWIPDPKSTTCMMVGCGTKFNVFNRRHHCRNCGWLICRSCVGYAPVKKGSVYLREKVCPACYFEISAKWAGAYDTSLFSTPPGGVRRKLQLPSRNDKDIVSGTIFVKNKKGSEEEKWGRLKQHEDGVLVLHIYEAEYDHTEVEKLVLMGFEVKEVDLEEGGRWFKLCHTNQIQGHTITFAFRVAHSGNAARWSHAFAEHLQAFTIT